MMSSYYHPAKEADMTAMTEPLCLERGNRARVPELRAPGGALRRELMMITDMTQL